VAQFVEVLGYKPEVRGFDSLCCQRNFSLKNYGPGVDSTSYRNEYQEYFLGSKGGWCLGLTTYHLHMPIVWKCGSLNLLKPSGPVQTCNGIALPNFYFLYTRIYTHIYKYRYINTHTHTHAARCYGHRVPTYPQYKNYDADMAVLQPRPSLETVRV
jgi:hypothetical protein